MISKVSGHTKLAAGAGVALGAAVLVAACSSGGASSSTSGLRRGRGRVAGRAAGDLVRCWRREPSALAVYGLWTTIQTASS
jgi:hypothetical protein